LAHAAVQHAPGAIDHDAVRDEKGLRPGGFGLVLIRAIADELIYNEQQNEVVFVKYLDLPGSDARQVPDDPTDADKTGRGGSCDASRLPRFPFFQK
jgi:hypothetical protein